MNVVHVVQTRFMQFQPQLSQLGWARFYLFRAITLPSMLLQTNQDFLWIIRADPNLNNELKSAMKELVKDYPNIALSGSNTNPEGFKCSNCIEDLKDNLWSGSWEMIESYWEAAKTHTVLETRLDADDALWLGYIDWIQTRGNVEHWKVWCPENHLEWHSGRVWRNRTSEKGSLIGLHLPHCVTAGLTWGYGVGTDLHDTPTHKHEQIHKHVPACAKNTTDQCLLRVTPPDQMPSVLRARTLTSAGMEHVLADGKSETPAEESFRKKLRHSSWQNSQEELFEGMMFVFGISDVDLQETKEFLEDHKAEIAMEALKGQCTKGHSCKNETKLLLNNVLGGSKEDGINQASK
ncbi:hypothetical protein FisN_1Hu054 [Fistulifera solaris]|jgi:hypothetical protein|uniref:Uncharacterized protein n=1 Tax=Fistulifera solaris TaxID=1519565 RepID=A0A1Z5JDS4_FISSO|nr:hypothetical protein FisN_1Hu054 [Fistulifera solaris]|eukprot:GAX12129.1 hypothetical protein FisN_1Hu054 [Fistulifera solaris]